MSVRSRGLSQAGGIIAVICRRGMRKIRTRPALIVPVLFMPLFFVISFTGAFSSLTRIRGYGTDNIFNWLAVYAVLTGSVFAGMGGPNATAEDIENGFFDRLLLAPGSRIPVLLGTVAFSAIRSTIPTTAVLLLSFANGLSMPGGPVTLLIVYLATSSMASVFCLIGLSVVYKFRTVRSMFLTQAVAFTAMFLSTGQVPIGFLDGWLHEVARINPVTNVLRLGRQGFLGDLQWSLTWPGLVALAAMLIVSGGLALRQLDRLSE